MEIIKSAIFWILFPLLIPQALWVRQRAPRFSAAQGPDHGQVRSEAASDPTPLRLIAIGDSIIAGVGAQTSDRALANQVAVNLAEQCKRDVEWRALGSIGAGTAKVRQQLLPRAPQGPMDVVVVSAGVNDLTALSTLGRWRTEMSTLLDALHHQYPDATIVLAGIPPLHGFPLLPPPLRWVFGMRGRQFDRLAMRLAAERHWVEHVALDFEPTPDQFSPDGFHPAPASYAVFGQMMAHPVIQRMRQALLA